MPMADRQKFIPVIVGLPLFLQNLDTSVMATALPSIAASLQVEPLDLNLAITSYLLSLAIFLPVSGWLAERYGARRIFCLAIAFFTAGSALCGAASSLPSLVFFRVLQGLGGAMMLPVGRLILLRSVSPAHMVAAMVWFTVPPTIGRMVGPLFGGAVVTWTSWRWIFGVNVPFGLLAIALALAMIEDTPANATPAPFDTGGFVLLGLGLAGLLGALETANSALVPHWGSALAACLGAVLLLGYWLRSRQQTRPLIDLGVLRYRTYFVSNIGGFPLRIGIGASPFLLPLMLQLGFGLSPLTSGLLTMATAIGSLATRAVMTRTIKRLGFRKLLLTTTTLASAFYAIYGLFAVNTPHLLIFGTLLVGGLINSMGLVALATLSFAEIPPDRMSHATTLGSMVQQLSISFGVMLGAAAVSAAAWWHGHDATHLAAADFPPAFLAVGLTTVLSLFFFVRLKPGDGDGLRGGASRPETP